MNRSRTSGLALLLSTVLGTPLAPAASDPVVEDPVGFYGPLRARDTGPFGYLRLDMRPSFAGAVPEGRWAFESELAYQNTWALTKRVEDYLQTLEGRRTLGPAEVEAIRALPGENYLVDLETAQFDFVAHRQLSRHWGVFAILSGVEYGSGALDGAVEQFHASLGATDYGRESVDRGQSNLVIDLKSARYTALAADPTSGLLDPTVGVRYTGIALPQPWGLVVEGAVKVPVAGERAWLSSGRADAGLQGTFTRHGSRHALYGSVAVVRYAGADGPLESDAKVLPTLVAGIESHVTRRTHSIVQLYASPSIYGRDETDLGELRADEFTLSAGVRHQRGQHLFTAAVTENVGNTRNTPDIGLQMGWAYRPR